MVHRPERVELHLGPNGKVLDASYGAGQPERPRGGLVRRTIEGGTRACRHDDSLGLPGRVVGADSQAEGAPASGLGVGLHGCGPKGDAVLSNMYGVTTTGGPGAHQV